MTTRRIPAIGDAPIVPIHPTGPAPLDDLAALAALACRVPIALVSASDEAGRWHQHSHGWDHGYLAPWDSPCVWTFGYAEGLAIEDLHADRRFAARTFTQRHPAARFFAGMPIFAPADSDATPRAIGAVCILDVHPRRIDARDLELLRRLASTAAATLSAERATAAARADQARAEAAGRLHEACDRSLAEVLPQNILRKDLDGRFIFANRQYCELFGLALADIIGKTDFDLYPPEMAAKFQADDRQVLEEGRTHEGFETSQGATGTLCVHVIKSPIRDAEGAVVGLQCIFWDVTDRQALEQDLHTERQLLRAMLDLSPDLIYFKDRESRFLKVSRSLAMRAGVDDPDHLVGKTDADIFDSVHAEEALQDERTIMDGGAPVIAKTEREVWLDGRERWVTTTKIAWRDRAGEAMGTIGVSRDITELRKLEMDLHQAQKLESIGRLAAGVAHEINTPIQFVSDSVHFVRDAVADLTGLIDRYQALCRQVATGQPALEAALDASAAEEAADLVYLLEHVPKALTRSLDGLDRVATIVRSMKEFAHPDQKEMTLVDLNRAVTSTLVIARNEYKYVADVETSLGDIPLVRCHGGDVNQAMLNIIVNAAHAIADVVAGSDRRGTITVSTRQEGDMAVVAIADTGGGIPQAIQDRIFDPFFTTKEVGRGTGQGLAIARTVIVDKHRGDLSFECEPGVGTTFLLRLPIEPRPFEQAVATEWAI